MVRQKMLHLCTGCRLGGSRPALVLSRSGFLEYATTSDVSMSQGLTGCDCNCEKVFKMDHVK